MDASTPKALDLGCEPAAMGMANATADTPARSDLTRPLSLRWHLIGLIVAAVLPIVVFSAAMMLRASEQERGALMSRAQDKAIQIASGVDTELRQTIAALNVLAQANALVSGDFPAFHALTKRVLEAQPRWANIILIGARGEHLTNARLPFGTPLPALLRPDLPAQAARSRQPVVSDMVAAAVANTYMTVVYVPVLRASGQVPYVLAAAIEKTNWQEFLDASVPRGFHGVLLDRNLSIIAGSGDAVANPARLDGLVAALARAENGGSPDKLAEAGRAYGAHDKASLSGWTAAVLLPNDRALSPASGSLAGLLAGFGLLFALGISLALLWAGAIARAISRLSASVEAVGQGGAPQPVTARIAEVDTAGRSLAAAAALLRESAAAERRVRDELQAMNRAKDEFLATLSHELRNPLGSITTSLLLLDRAEPGSEQAACATQVLHRQLAQLRRLVDDLLDVARIARGKMELRKERLDLSELVRAAAQDHGALMAESGVRFDLDICPPPVWVEGDPARLAQIIGNLLHNAAKFTPRGGRIALSLALLPGGAEIRVRDTGAGIEPPSLERLFEPFVQGPQASGHAGGLGLGLALVRRLVQLHGGSVRAFSEGAGKGAAFAVRLPTLTGTAEGEG